MPGPDVDGSPRVYSLAIRVLQHIGPQLKGLKLVSCQGTHRSVSVTFLVLLLMNLTMRKRHTTAILERASPYDEP